MPTICTPCVSGPVIVITPPIGGDIEDPCCSYTRSEIEALLATKENRQTFSNQAEMEAGNETGLRSMSPLLVAQAIAFQSPPLNQSLISMTLVADASNALTGFELTEIPDQWKQLQGTLTALSIGYGVTKIGVEAFDFCLGFTGPLVIPNAVTIIEDLAFANCSGFTGTLTISNSVVTIGHSAFSQCTGFTGALVLPTSITKIETATFFNCPGLTSLFIPDSVTWIRGTAFKNCSGFTGSLDLSAAVATIESGAFDGCSGITSINILADPAPTIDATAFANMTGVSPAIIHVPVGATGYAASYDGLTVVYDL